MNVSVRAAAICDQVGVSIVTRDDTVTMDLTIEEAEEIMQMIGKACATARGWTMSDDPFGLAKN